MTLINDDLFSFSRCQCHSKAGTKNKCDEFEKVVWLMRLLNGHTSQESFSVIATIEDLRFFNKLKMPMVDASTHTHKYLLFARHWQLDATHSTFTNTTWAWVNHLCPYTRYLAIYILLITQRCVTAVLFLWVPPYRLRIIITKVSWRCVNVAERNSYRVENECNKRCDLTVKRKRKKRLHGNERDSESKEISASCCAELALATIYNDYERDCTKQNN